jgi:hypothetical protein
VDEDANGQRQILISARRSSASHNDHRKQHHNCEQQRVGPEPGRLVPRHHKPPKRLIDEIRQNRTQHQQAKIHARISEYVSGTPDRAAYVPEEHGSF